MKSYLLKNFTGNSRSVTVKKNIAASFIVKGISIVISLMLVPMTLGYVSAELYGIWLTLSSIMLWLNFFDVGFTLGLKNKLAETIARGEWERGKALVSTTYFMMLVIFLPLCLILETCVPLVDWSGFLNVSSTHNAEIVKTLHVLVLFFCLQMIVNVLTAVVAAFQKVALSSAFPVIGNFFSLIAIWLLIKLWPPSLLALALAISSMPVIVIITASVILYSRQFHSVAPSFRCVQIKYIKDLFSLGARFFLIQMQVVILYQCTNILISNVSGPEDVTAYNIAYKYIGISMMAYTIILTPLWPAFTDAYTKHDYTWMRNVYKKMTKVYFMSVGVMLLMLAISPIVYKIWIGDKADVPFAVTLWICVYMLIYNWDSLQVNLINGIGTVRLQTYVTMIGLVVHIPLAVCLGKYAGMGAIGVVMSMIVINFIYSIFFTIQINRLLSNKAQGIWQA